MNKANKDKVVKVNAANEGTLVKVNAAQLTQLTSLRLRVKILAPDRATVAKQMKKRKCRHNGHKNSLEKEKIARIMTIARCESS